MSAQIKSNLRDESIKPNRVNQTPQYIRYRWCAYYKFELIYRKYMKHLYLQINLLKN
jgi:hypothetical protein